MKCSITLIACSLCIAGADAQNVPVNFAAWPGIELNMPLRSNAPWRLYTEMYAKRVNFVKDPQATEIVVGLSRDLKNGNRITAGAAYQLNYPYDEAALPYEWPDWRVWQQFMVRKPGIQNKDRFWINRFRLEERWFGRKSDPTMEGYDSRKFEITLRYQLRTQWFVR